GYHRDLACKPSGHVSSLLPVSQARSLAGRFLSWPATRPLRAAPPAARVRNRMPSKPLCVQCWRCRCCPRETWAAPSMPQSWPTASAVRLLYATHLTTTVATDCLVWVLTPAGALVGAGFGLSPAGIYLQQHVLSVSAFLYLPCSLDAFTSLASRRRHSQGTC